jgi:solute carrier family 12 sodium/potassium/chloride transporter 2
VAAQLDFIAGTMMSPSDEQKAKGFVGFSVDNFERNMWPEFSLDSLTGRSHNFFTVFAVFFPGCSGIFLKS